ncbi:MAG TPA: MBL fold metallo-hydrolase, partial [Tepidiformaceae bacterium]|nr:MBL fold metallo-hydrolase [Tepidiformaceae bacterium]
PGETTAVAGLELQALPVEHDERLSATLGFTGSLDGRRLAYAGDSAMCEAVIEMARHAEVLVTECASIQDRVPIHMNLVDDMPTLRAAMHPDAELILTHIDVGVTAAGMKRTRVAEDLATYRF